MANSRYRRKPRTRRNYRPKPVSKARYVRELYRGTKRRPIRRRPMTKKRILNMTSTKKRDSMLTYTNSTAATQQGSTTYSASVPAIVTGGQALNAAATFLWCATARDNTTTNANNRGTQFDMSTRTSSTPYMIGLKEAIEIQVSTGMPWQWRRICFTTKGPLGLTYDSTFAVATETSNGWVRLLNQVQGDPGGGQQYILFERLFRGQNTVDWNDVMTAKVDTSRVTLKYDQTTSLASGNEDGFIRKYNRWHDMHKTLVYNDDELGGATNATTLSTIGKAGMGDYYVLDLFRARTGSTTSDQLSFRPESTLYWHEK
uniref:Capsid protein n=1 Tax=Giant panda feces-associated gemycircularvirus TaxID=2864014 RepID=A0A8K1M4Z8_9VIRU|nr:capsid protein [Giant panda feces-associated gemycircularvirus]